MKRKNTVRFGICHLFIVLLASSSILTSTSMATNSSSEIFENISYDKNSLLFAEILDDFETVTSNPDLFLKDVEDGRVKIKLLGKEFDLELEETHIVDDNATINIENETGSYIIPAPRSNSYIGTVVGEENSRVLLTVSDDVLIGSIELENTSYVIEQTNKTVDGKVILVVYSSDNIKEIENPEFSYCGVYETNLSVAGKQRAGELNNSNNNNSDNSGSSAEGNSSAVRYSPGFELLGSLTCLYGGWNLRKK